MSEIPEVNSKLVANSYKTDNPVTETSNLKVKHSLYFIGNSVSKTLVTSAMIFSHLDRITWHKRQEAWKRLFELKLQYYEHMKMNEYKENMTGLMSDVKRTNSSHFSEEHQKSFYRNLRENFK